MTVVVVRIEIVTTMTVVAVTIEMVSTAVLRFAQAILIHYRP